MLLTFLQQKLHKSAESEVALKFTIQLQTLLSLTSRGQLCSMCAVDKRMGGEQPRGEEASPAASVQSIMHYLVLLHVQLIGAHSL